MNKRDISTLKSIKYHEKEYGYRALNDYYNYHRLKSLPKIHKLKARNRTLSSQRKVLMSDLFKHDNSSLTFSLLIVKLNRVSEQMGKNSANIQRLITQYKQFGESWVKRTLDKRNTKQQVY